MFFFFFCFYVLFWFSPLISSVGVPNVLRIITLYQTYGLKIFSSIFSLPLQIIDCFLFCAEAF